MEKKSVTIVTICEGIYLKKMTLQKKKNSSQDEIKVDDSFCEAVWPGNPSHFRKLIFKNSL